MHGAQHQVLAVTQHVTSAVSARSTSSSVCIACSGALDRGWMASVPYGLRWKSALSVRNRGSCQPPPVQNPERCTVYSAIDLPSTVYRRSIQSSRQSPNILASGNLYALRWGGRLTRAAFWRPTCWSRTSPPALGHKSCVVAALIARALSCSDFRLASHVSQTLTVTR